MDEIAHLLQLLQSPIKSPIDLLHSLRSPSSIIATHKFHSILKHALHQDDHQDGTITLKLGLENWNESQIQAVVSVAKSIISPLRSLPFKQVEPGVVAVVKLALEFAVCVLEKWTYTGSDELCLQNNVAQLLEIALVVGMDKESNVPLPCLEVSLLELLPVVPVEPGGIELDSHSTYNLQGINCSKEEKHMEQVLKILASVSLNVEGQSAISVEHGLHQDLNSMISLSQHWAVVHMICLPRLFMIYKELFDPPKSYDSQIELGNFRARLSFGLRTLKLLGNFTRDVPTVTYDAMLLQKVSLCADSLPRLFSFRPNFESANCQLGASESSIEGLVLLIFEEFLHSVQGIFCDSNLLHNIQTCLVANIIDILGADLWSYSISDTDIRPPLVYFPQSIMYLLKTIRKLLLQKSQFLLWKEKMDIDLFEFSVVPELKLVTCHVRSEKVYLLNNYTYEEQMKIIFSSSSHWLDNLLHLAFFLHAEGVKLKPKFERSHSSCSKTYTHSDLENAISHEDEALFGNLFSEVGRTSGSTDGLELPSSVVTNSCILSYSNMPIKVATELLSFFRECIFSPGCPSSVYKGVCEALSESHIYFLLSILNCQACLSEAESSAASLPSQRTVGHINQICFELLHNLLSQRALSDSLEEFLVHQILNVEDGVFVYNDFTLTLLAHIIICKKGLSGSPLKSTIFKGYVDFIIEKAKYVSLKRPSVKELLESLPCNFHIEIVLLTFHLCEETLKQTLASFLFTSLREFDAPIDGFSSSQLSCWALLISRLIVMLRYIIFYPSICSSWLLVDIRSKLREVPLSGSCLSNYINDHLLSWPSIVVENLMGDSLKKDPILSSLLLQLIDVSKLPSPVSRDNQTLQHVLVRWDDIYELFSWIMGRWSNKKAEAVEDLILERYIFILCWDIPVMESLSSGNSLQIETSNTELFFRLSQLLSSSLASDYPAVIVDMLQQLHTLNAPDTVAEMGWNFLRNGACISLILSVLYDGLHGYCVKNEIPGVELLWNGSLLNGRAYLAYSENMVLTMITDSNFAWIFRVLSSLLNGYLQTLPEAFLCTLNCTNFHLGKASPLLLVKHTEFEKSDHDKLLQMGGPDTCQLDSVYGVLSKLEEIVHTSYLANMNQMFISCLLHGFPSHSASSSGALLSCAVIIREIVYTLEALVKIKDVGLRFQLEPEVTRKLLDSLMTVKSDRIFQSIHERCEAIFSSLLGACSEDLDYNSLFALKQMEGFVKDINCRGATNINTHEILITRTVDAMESLKKDPSKVGVLKFFLGTNKGVSQEVKDLCGDQSGNLLVLIDALDEYYSESVNVKVLNFFVDIFSGNLCPGLKVAVQHKFLGLDLISLSKWLEKRLLGIIEVSSGVRIAKGSSPLLRESTMNFILQVMSLHPELQTRDFSSHIVEAALMSLDTAFMSYEIHIAKAYFHSVVQLSNSESTMKQLLNKTVMLMEKLADNESSLSGLKFLLGFLGTVLSYCGGSKNVLDKQSEKYKLDNKVGGTSIGSKVVGTRRKIDALLLAANQDTGSTSLDCDATSVDEDEDEGTSDGELASIEKDDEDDSNSERALASKVCTFTSSGSNCMEQHWYFCYTCDLTVLKGCCSVCAKTCHRGHRVVYSRLSRFFCNCGHGEVRGSSCQCLKPREFTASSTEPDSNAGNSQYPSFMSFVDTGVQLPDSDSDMDNDGYADMQNSFKLTIPAGLRDEIAVILEDLDVESRVLRICNKLVPVVISNRDSDLSKEKQVLLGQDKVLSYNVDLLQLKKAYKSGSLDLKIKCDYSNARNLKSHLASGSLVKSLLTVNSKGRLAAGEGDKVSIFDVGQLIGQAAVAPVMAEKANVKPLSKNVIRFEIVHTMFNPAMENYLVVAGYEECQVLTVNPRGEVTDRLPIELALHGAYIRRVDWVPGSQVQLMVVTNMFVKIYDLSRDNISPIHYFTLSNDLISDATFVLAHKGKNFLLVLSELGGLYRLELSLDGDIEAMPLKEIIQVPGKEIPSSGLSLYFSSSYRLLFISYLDGTTLIGRLNDNASSLSEISTLYEDYKNVNLKPAGLHHWKELLAGRGLFICSSSLKSNAVVIVSMGYTEVFAQNMRHTALPIVGITGYKPLSKDKSHYLVLHEDGSLQIYSQVSFVGTDERSATSVPAKKLGSEILCNKVYAALNPEFPLDFFEKTVCITADVKLSGDAIRNSDSDGTKQNLASDDGFLQSPNPSGFKITVSNSNPDIVMVGFRLHVGNSSVSHIPSLVKIFQRNIKIVEGMRSWYDIPFTIAESLLADEEFTIFVGPTFKGSTLARIDSLEVYGMAKDDFGWKEKVDAILDMETLGSKSGVVGLGKKCQSMQSIQEQVVADGMKLLSKFYSICGSIRVCFEIEQVKAELGKLKCKDLLETIFESDREPILHSAACQVLQSLFPKREIYHHVKDTMRLLGIVKSLPILALRLGGGGVTGILVLEEFMAQMRSISKIALHRRSNLATFLESYGSGIMDGLMDVLWGILDIEQPDIQTINKIVLPSVELIYSYAECLVLQGSSNGKEHSVAPAVALLKKLLFAPNEAVQSSTSLAISSRLLQVPYPQQTMLSTDDAAENIISTTPAVASDIASATGGTTGVLIEEDPATSSAQYCCNGCSTIPILRHRWHYTVCPDFDLCDACYQVLDANRLPQLHSREHPMSAIPIEVESVGGNGNEIHFSIDELRSGCNLLPVAASDNANLQNSSPPIHILEAEDDPTEFSSPLISQRTVSISASKRMVNSILLVELVEQLKGWMEKTNSGIRVIPVMQLFYRLSSAVGGPFMDSSNPDSLDLEKFIQWFLDEINLENSFVAKTHSSFGEAVILVFMYFTLMLRNWHQPGSELKSSDSMSDTTQEKTALSSTADATPSPIDEEKNEFVSQLLRACCSLRQQKFVSYLMDILEQLLHVFNSASSTVSTEDGGNLGLGCGALLIVRRDLPAGNYAPFFSDLYAKAHRSDIFMDYQRLLLENTFRLLYSLVRPDKSGERKSSSIKDLKLDGYQDVLCSYINNSNTTFVRRYARRLFLHLCGSKTHYYNVRDSWQLSSEVKKLYKLVHQSGGFENPVVSYERSVKVVKCLSALSKVATARPRNWQKYCSRHADVLDFLLKGVFYFSEESVTQTLKLLNLAFYMGKDSVQKGETGDTGVTSSKVGDLKKKKNEDGGESGLEKSYLDMGNSVDIFSESLLRQFIDCFLLEWNSNTVRVEAKCVLYGIWHHGKQSFKVTMLTTLLQKVTHLPMYGQNIGEYTELTTWLLGKNLPDSNSSKQQDMEVVNRCLTPDIIRCIFETLHSQNKLLANHPNSRLYNTLSYLVEFDGYYLESEPCVACSCPEVPYSRMKLESLKSETKFTDNRIIVKCTGSYTIQTVTMNVHDACKSKSVKVLNLYYNNKSVTDLSELKNNWSLWKRAKSCHLSFNQTELKFEFPIPITVCNFMIELDSFYENLQASSLESLQCPRCSRSVTDKHGTCSNCRENAYQCRQCRNINYENLDSFLCNECGYSKYGRFEFNFMAKPSFSFDIMENDEDMKKGLAAIESESENAHKRYQQLLGLKKPLLKVVSSIGENDMDSQQKDSVQQMMMSLPGPSCKINRKIALLGVLYGEKCKAAFDSVSKSVQTLQGLRHVLMDYLHRKQSDPRSLVSSKFAISRSPNNCYGCAATFITQCLELLLVLSKHQICRKQLVAAGILIELFENNIHQGPKTARVQARAVLCAFSEGDLAAVAELNCLIQKKVLYCLEHHRSMDIALSTHEELLLLSETCSMTDELWESRLRVAFQLLFSSIKLGAGHPAISEHVILPCLRIISQACTPPKPDTSDKDQAASIQKTKDDNTIPVKANVSGGKSVLGLSGKKWSNIHKTQDIQLVSYSEWEKGTSYIDFIRRRYIVSQAVKVAIQKSRSQSHEYLALKYGLKWKRRACSRVAKSSLPAFELGSWISELALSACSQSIRSEMCTLISLLCTQSSARQLRLLTLLMALLPASLSAGESAAEYFELLFKMVDSEDDRLFLTARGNLSTLCKLISQEVSNVESQEMSLHIDISQGFILHKLIELLGKFLEVPIIRSRFIRDNLLSVILEALIVIRGLVVQKTKLITDCNKNLKDLLDSLLLESSENKRQFIRACVSGLQIHGEKKGRISLFILEQLCNMICPSKPEPVYLLVLNKAHTQEEFIRGSMTKNPYSSTEIGPLMRDVKKKICYQLELLDFVEEDCGMELLVAGNIISLDLSISLVYNQVWKKTHFYSSPNATTNSALLSSTSTTARDCLPMSVTYRLQGVDGEATEPMIKDLEEDKEETQDPEVEFAIAGAVREYGGLEVILSMIQHLGDDDLKSNQERLVLIFNLLKYCCKIRENRRALLRLGALVLLLETARRAFSLDAMEPAEGILLIVESLTMEANESDISITQSMFAINNEEAGASEQAKKIVLMFLERLCHTSDLKKSNKQRRNTDMVARILPYLTYGDPAAMEALVQHFDPHLRNWSEFDKLQKQDNPVDENLAQQAVKQRFTVENFVAVSESLKTSSCGERLKDIILEKGIVSIAVRYLRDSFAISEKAGFKSTAEWAVSLGLPSVPMILSMLQGLSKGHLATQECIDSEGILLVLHALEGVPGENNIGARAENLLDTLSDKDHKGDGFLEKKVCKLRHATRDEKRRRALRKREELLQGLGMRQELASDGGERIIVTQPSIEGLDEVEEEEDGVACMVCREGYSLRPNDMLGIYCYSKRVNLGVGTSGSSRGECVYTTVSHFNIIHYQCHQEAKRADAALKNPKKEWDGATLRNNETLCNCLFPLRGPSVSSNQYVRYVDQYWDSLNALGHADGTRLRLLTYDIVLMLARFATGASFSTDSKGGGRESNSRFLPFMIQMARHLLDQGGSTQAQTMSKAVSSYLASSSSDSRVSIPSGAGGRPSTGSEETVQFMMVHSLLCESYESWLKHRSLFLQRGIYHAYMQHTHGRSLRYPAATILLRSEVGGGNSIRSEAGSEDLFSIVLPMLLYTGLIDQLQRFCKKNTGNGPSKESFGKFDERGEAWEVLMKDKLVNIKELVGLSKGLLLWLKNMSSAENLQEAFDIMGALSDVISGGFAKCEEFVQAAIQGDKN